ncbi:hypothetical protein IG631_07325 [Alternaria alternata]|nr:hypothetical protein IG631_07325 [Alternaria alternata]
MPRLRRSLDTIAWTEYDCLVTKTPVVGKSYSTLLSVFLMVGASPWPTLSGTWRSSAPKVRSRHGLGSLDGIALPRSAMAVGSCH